MASKERVYKCWSSKFLDSSLDILAISLDGPPEIHNRMRGAPQAFERLCTGLENLRRSGLPFGFIHTATRESWIHLLWVAEFYAGEAAGGAGNTPAAAQMGVLVLEPDGTLVPVSYGFARRYRISNIRQQTVASAWGGFVRDTYPSFRALCRAAFDQVVSPGSPPLFNWHERITALSHVWLPPAPLESRSCAST